MLKMDRWESLQYLRHPRDFHCAYCGNQVGSNRGYSYELGDTYAIAICPRCANPTYCQGTPGNETHYPDVPPGESVSNIPSDLGDLYEEARQSAGAGAYTACVMVCRKMLMNIAVREGAKAGENFKNYVDYLEKHGYFSPKSKGFIDYIRELGNEANHEVAAKKRVDAIAALEFVAALLRHNYDLPSKVPSIPPSATAGSATAT